MCLPTVGGTKDHSQTVRSATESLLGKCGSAAKHRWAYVLFLLEEGTCQRLVWFTIRQPSVQQSVEDPTTSHSSSPSEGCHAAMKHFGRAAMKRFGITLYPYDLDTLLPNQWLNDQVMCVFGGERGRLMLTLCLCRQVIKCHEYVCSNELDCLSHINTLWVTFKSC